MSTVTNAAGGEMHLGKLGIIPRSTLEKVGLGSMVF